MSSTPPGQKPNPELTAVLKVFDWLRTEGAKARSLQQPTTSPQFTQAAMQSVAAMISDTDLDALLALVPDTGNLGKKWIYCPKGYGSSPIIVPAVTARWDFSGTPAIISIFVLFGISEDDGSGGRKLTGSLFRYENGDIGTAHDFDHAQPTSSLVRGDPPIQGLQHPLHTSTPAFSLDALGPVGIAMCVVRSIYGAKQFAKIMRWNHDLNTALYPYYKQMPAFYLNRLGAKPAPW